MGAGPPQVHGEQGAESSPLTSLATSSLVTISLAWMSGECFVATLHGSSLQLLNRKPIATYMTLRRNNHQTGAARPVHAPHYTTCVQGSRDLSSVQQPLPAAFRLANIVRCRRRAPHGCFASVGPASEPGDRKSREPMNFETLIFPPSIELR